MQMENPSIQIRNAMSGVEALRERVSRSAELSGALHDIKTLQARRFSYTYRDLLQSPVYKGSTDFFLTELYSERDYGQRDKQFSKVAGAIEVAFPKSVITTSVNLAELHLVTETLDIAMAEHAICVASPSLATRYCRAWRTLDCPAQRQWQLDTVISIGTKLGELTRRRGLRLLLKMMRHPAEIAGLSELQGFLEKGFDRFRELSREKNTLATFLETIQDREATWLQALNTSTESEAVALIEHPFDHRL